MQVDGLKAILEQNPNEKAFSLLVNQELDPCFRNISRLNYFISKSKTTDGGESFESILKLQEEFKPLQIVVSSSLHIDNYHMCIQTEWMKENLLNVDRIDTGNFF